MFCVAFQAGRQIIKIVKQPTENNFVDVVPNFPSGESLIESDSVAHLQSETFRVESNGEVNRG